MKKFGIYLIFLLFLFAFIARLYRITNPIADWHAWRQADTSAVSKKFVQVWELFL